MTTIKKSQGLKTSKTRKVETNQPTLPPPNPIKIPQHVICKELAEKGYRARQVSEITGISYNNVAWYFSKYKLNEIALKVLEAMESMESKRK